MFLLYFPFFLIEIIFFKLFKKPNSEKSYQFFLKSFSNFGPISNYLINNFLKQKKVSLENLATNNTINFNKKSQDKIVTNIKKNGFYSLEGSLGSKTIDKINFFLKNTRGYYISENLKSNEKVFLDEIDGVFVVDFDRLSRDFNESFTIREQFKKHNVRLFDTNGEISLFDETHSLLLNVKSLLGDFEIQRTRTRIKRNLERNALDGKVGGGNLLNYGYRKGKDKRFEIDDIESEVVKLIFALCIQGMGTKVISNYIQFLFIKS